MKKVVVKRTKHRRVADLVKFLRKRIDEDRADAFKMLLDEWPKEIHVVPAQGKVKAFIAVQPMKGAKKFDRVPEEGELSPVDVVQQRGVEIWGKDRAATIVTRCDSIEKLLQRAETVASHHPKETAVDAFIFSLMAIAQEYAEYPGFDQTWRLR